MRRQFKAYVVTAYRFEMMDSQFSTLKREQEFMKMIRNVYFTVFQFGRLELPIKLVKMYRYLNEL